MEQIYFIAGGRCWFNHFTQIPLYLSSTKEAPVPTTLLFSFLFPPPPPPSPPFDPSCLSPSNYFFRSGSICSCLPLLPATLFPPFTPPSTSSTQRSPQMEGLCPLACSITPGPRDLWGQTLRPLPNSQSLSFYFPSWKVSWNCTIWVLVWPATSLFSLRDSYLLDSGKSKESELRGFGAKLFKWLPQFSTGLFRTPDFEYIFILGP